MGLERAAIDHTCNVIRRQVQEEYKDLTLVFVVHKDKKRQEALDLEELNILSHKCGKAALDVFKKQKKKNKTSFLGLFFETKGKFLSFFKHTCTLGLFFVNVDEYETVEEAKEHIYHLVWHALELAEIYSLEGEDQKPEGLVTPQYSPIELAKNNLMADVFAAVMQEFQEHKGTIETLAQRRAQYALKPIAHYQAEKYPYPIAMETTKLVYEDLAGSLKAKTKVIHLSLQLAQEVGTTYDAQSIKQWWAFSTRAQEMAWMGFDHEHILSTALFTSEDPYARSTAYLVSEALDIEPKTLADLTAYNPFTDQEANERLHNKACDEAYRSAISQTALTDDYDDLMDEAYRQNKKLEEGHILGWCAHALLEAANIFKNSNTGDEKTLTEAAATFHRARAGLTWETMYKMSKTLMKTRRQGRAINAKTLEEISKENPEFSPFVSAFKATLDYKPRAKPPAEFPILPGEQERMKMAKMLAMNNPKDDRDFGSNFVSLEEEPEEA